jgi:DNA-binding transcriptional LysR family regulator
LAAALDTGSFTGAVERLGLSRQFISKRMMALEQQLGVRLRLRTTRPLRATDLGRAYHEHARTILQQVDELEQTMTGAHRSPRGRLRITAPVSFGTMHLSPLLPKFLADYPEVSVDLELSDRMVDLLGEGYDLAVHIGVRADSSLVARRIAPVQLVLCCSPDYLKNREPPRALAELAAHDCLLYGHGPHGESAFGGIGEKSKVVTGRYRANRDDLLRDAAIQGLGITQLPTFIVAPALASGELVTVLDAFRLLHGTVHAVYPQHRPSSMLIHVFVEFLQRSFAVAWDGDK